MAKFMKSHFDGRCGTNTLHPSVRSAPRGCGTFLRRGTPFLYVGASKGPGVAVCLECVAKHAPGLKFEEGEKQLGSPFTVVDDKPKVASKPQVNPPMVVRVVIPFDGSKAFRAGPYNRSTNRYEPFDPSQENQAEHALPIGALKLAINVLQKEIEIRETNKEKVSEFARKLKDSIPGAEVDGVETMVEEISGDDFESIFEHTTEEEKKPVIQ